MGELWQNLRKKQAQKHFLFNFFLPRNSLIYNDLERSPHPPSVTHWYSTSYDDFIFITFFWWNAWHSQHSMREWGDTLMTLTWGQRKSRLWEPHQRRDLVTPILTKSLCVSCPTLDHAKRRMGQELYYTLENWFGQSEGRSQAAPDLWDTCNVKRAWLDQAAIVQVLDHALDVSTLVVFRETNVVDLLDDELTLAVCLDWGRWLAEVGDHAILELLSKDWIRGVV